MDGQKDILKKFESLKDNKQFEVPVGYFDSLPDKIMERIHEQDEKQAPKRPLFSMVRNQLAIAASFAALFLLAYTAIKLIAPDDASEILTESEIFAALESDIYYLDETYLYTITTADEQISISDNIKLTDEEIIEYLTEEGMDIDNLYSGF